MKIWKRGKTDVITNHLSLTSPQNLKSLPTKPEEEPVLDDILEISTTLEPSFDFSTTRRDVGTVEVFAGIENSTQVKVVIAPEPSQNQISHAPYFSTGCALSVSLAKGDEFRVFIDASNLDNLENTVDIFGVLTIANHDSSQLLVLNYSIIGASNMMQKFSPDLKVIRKIGKDLSVKSGDLIQSKTGGNFNVALNAQVTWS